MARYSITERNIRRKRTVAAFFTVSVLLMLVVAYFFYGHIRQERLLTAVDPPEETQDADYNDTATVPEEFFERAEEKSVELQEMYDKQRKSNIDSIHQGLQAYYATNGFYPKLSQMNSAGFRQATFPELGEEDFMDPDSKDTLATITRTPQITVYAYDVVNADGYTCEPSGRTCVDYTLTAWLSDDSHYNVGTRE